MYLVGCKWWTFGSKTCDMKLWNFICSGYVRVCVCLPGLPGLPECNGSRAFDCWHLVALLSKPTVPVIKMILFYFQAECEWVKTDFCQAQKPALNISKAIRIQFRFHPPVHQRNLQAPKIALASLEILRSEDCRLQLDVIAINAATQLRIVDGFATDTVNQYQSLSI